jgi:methylated-DNA-[protein]-cysteine S-methyltransferase
VKFSLLESDLGSIVLFARQSLLWRLDLVPSGPADARRQVIAEFPEALEEPRHFEAVARLLRQYLEGEQVEFDIPLDLFGYKAFTRQVLRETRKVPYGGLASYGTIAGRLGHPHAARAVGQALRRNPIPLVIPCHRIIRSDGTLGGFSIGLDTKVKLLSMEGIDPRDLRKSVAFS